MTAPLICCFCGERIKRGSGRDREAYDERTMSGIERAFHARCVPNYAPPDSPFNAAVQKAKQAIADAQRLSPLEQEAFTQIVGQALNTQRPG